MPVRILVLSLCLLFSASDASNFACHYSESELPRENSFFNVEDAYRDMRILAEVPQCNNGKKAEHSAPELPLLNEQEWQTSQSSSETSEEEKDRKYHEYLKKQRGKGNVFGTRELNDDEVEFKLVFPFAKDDTNKEIRHSPLVLFDSSSSDSPISDSTPPVYPLLACSVSPKIGCSRKLGTSITVSRPSVHGNNRSGSATGADYGDFSNQGTPDKTP